MKSNARFLKIGLLILAVVFIAVTARYNWANQQPLRRFPGIAVPNPNGFDLYVAAALSVQPGNPPVDEIYDRTEPTFAEKARHYTLKRHQEWLSQNAAAFALFERALVLNSVHPDARMQSAQDSRAQTSWGPTHSRLRALADFKIVQSKTLQLEGKWRAAVDARLDVFEMSNGISRGAGWIPTCVGFSLESKATLGLEALISHLTALDCQQLHRRNRPSTQTETSCIERFRALSPSRAGLRFQR